MTKIIPGELELREKSNGKWTCTAPDVDQLLFCGEGKTMAEAIGHFLISNREEIGFTFRGTWSDGEKFQSTHYGRSRGWQNGN